jgi:glyoxylase-like metal-dependent hydrolase (beta-lactamase superfamily II)
MAYTAARVDFSACSAIQRWAMRAEMVNDMHVTVKRKDAQHGTPDDLDYPIERAIEPGTTLEIAKNLVWLRLPLPFVLNHVNCWLLGDKAGWTIIDTGADRPQSRDIWTDVLANRLGGKPVHQLICTHGHPDHIGLAGWLAEKLGVRLTMTLAEWLAPQLWREQGLRPMSAEERGHLMRSGVAQAAIEKMAMSRESAPFRNHPLPMSFKRIRDGETLRFGGRSWKVLVNGGHADEHASFYCAREHILIAGDQILSKISPVVGVFLSQPWSDPLTDYLASLRRLAKLPADTLVLPSHGLPFRGLHTRIRQLERHHEERLARLHALMDGAKTGAELAEGLFPRAVADGQMMMALAETVAHANHLVTLGKVVREDGALVRFRRV